MRAATELIGRAAEVALLEETTRACRLTTVWGPPGVGKTRLVREVLDASLCSLAGADDVDGVCWAVARGLGLAPEGDVQRAVRRAVSASGRSIVLDGADAAASALSELLPTWLADPGPTLVITARRPLRLSPHEETIALAPLAREDAARLWARSLERLGHPSEPTLASAIAQRLDRLPLAIVWFAARAALLGEKAALEKLRGFSEGDDPLSSVLTQTLATLNAGDRELLALASAFEGGAGVAVFTGDELAAIERLASASLIHAEPSPGGRPRVRAYRSVIQDMRNAARADGSWERQSRRHAELVLSLFERASDAERAVLGVTERSELEVIVDRFERADPTLALSAQLRLCPLALHDGSAAVARDRLAGLVAELGETPARASLWLGRLERRLGHFDAARAHLQAAALGGETFAATIATAHIDRQESRSPEALAGYQRALDHARMLDDPRAQAIGLGEIGRMLQSVGRFREAQSHHEQAIALCRELAMPEREALERSLHARAVHRAGQVAEAIPLHEHALGRHHELGEARLAAAERGHLAFCHHELGAHDRAERLFRASVQGLARAGDIVLESIERILLARLLSDEQRLAEARLELAIVARAIEPLQLPRLELTRSFVAGLVELESGDLTAARACWRRAHALGLVPEVGFEALLPAYLALAESRLGDANAAERHFEESAAIVAGVDSVLPRAALAVIGAVLHDAPLPELDAGLVASSSDIRRALRLVVERAVLRLASDGRDMVLPDRSAVDLGRRAAPRRLLVALAEARLENPGLVMTHDALIEVGWPRERMLAEAAKKRLRTAIWTLRKLGLEPVILTRDDGYLLDPRVSIEWSR